LLPLWCDTAFELPMVASPLGEAQAARSCPNCSAVISFGVETGDDDWKKTT